MFEDMAFALIWLALPFLWYYLLKVAGLSLSRLSIPSWVMVVFYGLQYIGLPILYFQLNESRAASVNNQWIMYRVFFYTAITMTLMTFGFIAGRRFFGSLKWVGIAEIRKSSKKQMFGLLVLFGICSAVLLLYISKVGFERIALLTVFGLGEDVSVMAARSGMGNAFKDYHRYSFFMHDLLLFCVVAFFVHCLLIPHFRNRLFFGFVFLVATFSMIMATAKIPMANLLIALFMAYVLTRKEGLVPIKGSLYIGVILMAVLTLFNMYFRGIQSPVQAFLGVPGRVLTGQIQPAYHYLEFFPYHHDFLYGLSFPNPGGILPFDNFALQKEMMAWNNPSLDEIGVVGSMPTVYWGEMYANFGFIGVLLPPFFVGFVLYWLNSLIFKLSPDPLVTALFVWFMIHYQKLAMTSLGGFLFDVKALGVLFFFFTIVFISGSRIVKLKRNF